MKLKQKFETTMVSFLIDKNQDKPMIEHFEKVAEDFAIEFAEWLRGYKYDNAEIYHISSTKELLEIYKKEKGL